MVMIFKTFNWTIQVLQAYQNTAWLEKNVLTLGMTKKPLFRFTEAMAGNQLMRHNFKNENKG